LYWESWGLETGTAVELAAAQLQYRSSSTCPTAGTGKLALDSLSASPVPVPSPQNLPAQALATSNQ
jgi:hypothetical protein